MFDLASEILKCARANAGTPDTVPNPIKATVEVHSSLAPWEQACEEAAHEDLTDEIAIAMSKAFLRSKHKLIYKPNT
jgi:hypothetical protein